MYTFHSKVRYSEVGEDGRLSLPGLVNYFQDCSTFQSESLGVGVKELKQTHHAWLLNSWQIRLVELPKLCDDIAISTWAYDFKGFYGYRNFLIQDNHDRPLAYANSIWVYVDTQTGHPSRYVRDEPGAYPMEPPYPMDKTPRKIKIPEGALLLSPLTVRSSDLDTNHHMNNCSYIRMATDLLPRNFSCQQMRAEYRNAAILGDTILPSCAQQGDTYTILLASESGKTYAIVEFQSERSC